VVWSADERESPESQQGGAGRGSDVGEHVTLFRRDCPSVTAYGRGTWK